MEREREGREERVRESAIQPPANQKNKRDSQIQGVSTDSVLYLQTPGEMPNDE